MKPKFLSLKQVLRIQKDQIDRYGGEHGLRDTGLLESAIEMPRAGFGGQYFHADIFEMAAAYLFHLVLNHPFFDGNKRVGTAAAIVFLEKNKIYVFEDGSLEALVLDVAQGKVTKAEIAEWFRNHQIDPA